MLSNRKYNFLKAFGMVIAPTSVSLYLVLSPLHQLEHQTSTLSVLSALAAMLGVYLLLSTKAYYESDAPYFGALIVSSDESGKTVYQLEIDGDLDEIQERRHITFKVVLETSQ